MAHPKRKISKTRRDKRRTHDIATPRAISICQSTETPHIRHRAYVVNGDLYYNGKVVIENYTAIA